MKRREDSRGLAARAALFVGLVAACGDSGNGGLPPVSVDAGVSPPIIVRFEASNAVVDVGQSAFLGWETQNAESVSLRAAPGGTLLENSLRVNSVVESSPLVAPTTFTLVATNATGSVESTVEVGVRDPDAETPPQIIEFFVRPELYQGRVVEARVSWTAVGNLTLERNGEPVDGFTGEPFGAFTEPVTASRVVYRLSATGAGQTRTATQTVLRSEFELEPNDTPADASVPSGAFARGRLDEADRDLWAVEVPAQGRVAARVDDGAGGCPFDSVLELFRYDPDAPPGSALTFVASNDDASPSDPCSRIDPRVDPRASSLPAGLYVVRLSGATSEEIGQYRLIIEVGAAECGNGIVEFGAGEACDDGNTADGDGCTSACALDPLASLTAPDAADVTTPALMPGQRRFAVVELSSAGAIAAALDGTSCAAGRLWLRDATELEGADYRLVARADERCRIAPRALPAGRYLVELDGGEDGLPASELELFAAPSGCGDRIVTGAERCDDGNAQDGDGCSAQCQFEFSENTTSGVVDYETTLPASGFQAFLLREVRGSISVRPTFEGSCANPTLVTLRDASGRVLGAVEDENGCAGIDPSRDEFAADVQGTFVVTIESLAGAARPRYEVRPFEASCGNRIVETETGGEQCDEGGSGLDCNRFCRVQTDALLLDLESSMEPQPIQCGGGAPGVPLHRFDLDPASEIERVAITFAAPTLSAIFRVDTAGVNALNNQLRIRVYDPQYRLIAADDGSPALPPSSGRVPFVTRLDPEASPEPVIVEVERKQPTAPIIGTLGLRVPCFPIGVCGDNFLELGEQCDDGNLNDGDGCNRFCNFELPTTPENEGLTEGRNDRRDLALPLPLQFDTTSRPLVGSLFPPGDVDFYRVDIPSDEAYSLRAFISGDPSDPSLCRADVQGPLRLTLLDDAERVLASSDPEVGCADIDGVRPIDLGARDLPAGAYYLRVDRPSGGQAMSYSLVVRTVPAP